MPRRIRKGVRKRSTKSAGVVALKKVNKIIRNTEKKFVDVDDSIFISNTFTIIPLTLVGQGDTASSREGNKIVFSSMEMKYTLKIGSAASQTRCRILIVKDKQVNESLFTANDLLQSSAQGTAIVSPKNLDNMFRFVILYDKVHSLQNTGTSVNFAKMFKRMNMPARYLSTGGAITNIASNGLFLVALSDETTNTPALSYYIRTRFIDS